MNPEDYLDAILSLPDMADLTPIVSPNGHWVSWTWFGLGPVADVFATRTDGSIQSIRLTNTDENTLLVSWTLDSHAVLVEQDKEGNERAQLFRVDLDNPLEMIPLTEPDPEYYIRGGQLHPNDRWLVYAANYDFERDLEIEATWVYRHDMESGERLALAKPEKGVMMVPELNHLGSHILYTRKDLHPSGQQTWIVDIEGQNDRELLNFGPEVKTYARWFSDGKGALVMVETQTHKRLGLWDLDSNNIRWLLDDPGRDIEDTFHPYNSHQAVVVQNVQGRVHCSLLELDSGEESTVPQISGNLIPLAPVPRETQSKTRSVEEWIAVHFSSRQPTDIIRTRLDDPDPQKFISLARVWEQTPLRRGDLSQADDFSWRSVDGLEIHGWLYRTRMKSPLGTIIYVHGGPTWHSPDWIDPQIQYLCAQGFTVLDPNYRGSTGYGLPFREAILEDGWGGREQEDIRSGIEALIEAGIAAPGKVGITGTSYGGYSSWWAITHFPPELVAAAAPICGMTDLVVDYETTRPDIRPYSEEMMGGSPSQIPERYFERSPIHFVENIRGRLLIIQGAQDPNVTPKNVEDVIQFLKQAQIPYEILTFDDEGHGIQRKANLHTLFLRLNDFFMDAFR